MSPQELKIWTVLRCVSVMQISNFMRASCTVHEMPRDVLRTAAVAFGQNRCVGACKWVGQQTREHAQGRAMYIYRHAEVTYRAERTT